MDKGHLGGGGGLLALDASPRPLGFLNLLSPAPFHRTMEADDGGGGGSGGRGRRSVEVDFFSDEKKNMKKSRVADDHKDQANAAGLAIKKEDLTINVRPPLLASSPVGFFLNGMTCHSSRNWFSYLRMAILYLPCRLCSSFPGTTRGATGPWWSTTTGRRPGPTRTGTAGTPARYVYDLSVYAISNNLVC